MKYILIAGGALICLFVPSLIAGELSPAPELFHARIGGFNGFTYEIVLKRDYIEYVRSAGGQEPLRARVHPTIQQWRAFRTQLDAIGVWQWRTDYSDWGVADGTQWSLEVAYPDRAIKTQGSNDYPGARSDPSDGSASSKTFARYLKAVERLLGGKSFE